MFSALTPCPEQMETAGKGQGHDSLINTYCTRDQRKRRERGGTPGTWGGEAEAPSWRKSMGRVVSRPCLHYQQTAGLYLFTKLKVDQTPSSFWWLGQLLQEGICRGGPESPSHHTCRSPPPLALALPLSAPHPPLVRRQAAQWQCAVVLATFIDCSSRPWGWGSCQVGITPSGEALKTAAATKVRSHQ